MADWVKYCPKCGEENKGQRIICKCGADLRDVPKVPKGNADASKPPEKKKIYTVCSAASDLCQCGEELGSVLAIPEDKAEEVSRRAREASSEPQEKRKAASAQLVADDGFAYDIKPGKITIGRQSTMMEYLQPMLWVGRKHAELNFEDGVLTVQDLGSQNHTYVNGKKVRSGEVRELADGDVLGLGDSRKNTQDSKAAFFRIELR